MRLSFCHQQLHPVHQDWFMLILCSLKLRPVFNPNFLAKFAFWANGLFFMPIVYFGCPLTKD